MSGLTMGYEASSDHSGSWGAQNVQSGKAHTGEFIEKPAPTAGNIGYALTASAEFTRHGRRPFQVSILNDRTGDIFFLFDASTPTEWIDFGESSADAGVTTLEMSPIAWSGSHADSAVGDVIFHFRGDQ